MQMGVRAGILYTGIKLYDEHLVKLNEGVFDDSGPSLQDTEWTRLQEIPVDKHIVGFSCVRNDASPAAILHLSFLLADKGETEVSGELNFPIL